MKKWSKRREKAQSLFKNGRYNDAAIIFEKCVEQARTFPKVAINKGLLYCCLCQLGNCWYKLCKYDVAIPLFKESMEGVFESAGDECELYSEVLLLFSKCLLKTDRLTEAQNTLESALKLKRTERNGQNRFEFLMLLVDVAIARKEYTEAIDNLEKAEFIVSTILKDDLLLADVLSVMIISYSGMEVRNSIS